MTRAWQDQAAYCEEKGGEKKKTPFLLFQLSSPFIPPLLFSTLFYYSNLRSVH